MGTHDGHRARMKNRFQEYGLDNFDDHNVLELILFYAVPRRDTNGIAHELINTYGSLNAVFEAPADELRAINGLGDNAAVLLKLIPQVARRYMLSVPENRSILDSTKAAGEFILPYFMYERDEVVYQLCLDAKLKVLCCKEISRGEVNSTDISIRRIVELALSKNATSVIIAHNHPSGIALPSRDDEITTRRIKQALESIGIKLADHIVVGGGDFVSMLDSGMLTR